MDFSFFPKPDKGWFPHTKGMHETLATAQRVQLRNGDSMEYMAEISRLEHSKQLLMMMQLTAFQKWNRCRASVFVTPAMMEGCVNTDILNEVMGSEVRSPYPAILFYLPTSVRNGKTETRHVLISFYEPSSRLEFVANGETRVLEMPAEKFIIVNSFYADNECASCAVPLLADKPVGEMIRAIVRMPIIDEHQRHKYGENLPQALADTEEATELIVSLVCNFTMLMTNYPQYVKAKESGNRKTGGKHSRKTDTTLQYVGVLGDVTQKVMERERKEYNVTDRRTALHWRRGHWRRQIHTGAWEASNPTIPVLEMSGGRRAHRVWIQPVFVGGSHGRSTSTTVLRSGDEGRQENSGVPSQDGEVHSGQRDTQTT